MLAGGSRHFGEAPRLSDGTTGRTIERSAAKKLQPM
jgi:hypothetical protein